MAPRRSTSHPLQPRPNGCYSDSEGAMPPDSEAGAGVIQGYRHRHPRLCAVRRHIRVLIKNVLVGVLTGKILLW